MRASTAAPTRSRSPYFGDASSSRATSRLSVASGTPAAAGRGPALLELVDQLGHRRLGVGPQVGRCRLGAGSLRVAGDFGHDEERDVGPASRHSDRGTQQSERHRRHRPGPIATATSALRPTDAGSTSS